MAAALLMSATRGMLRSLAEACCSPAEVLARLNRLPVEDLPTGRFVTLVYAVFDPAKSTVTFASAGHLQPVLVSGGEASFLETEQGLPLALAPVCTRKYQSSSLRATASSYIAMVLLKQRALGTRSMGRRVSRLTCKNERFSRQPA